MSSESGLSGLPTQIAAFGGLVISIINWFVTHGSMRRLQNDLYLSQLRNDARLDLCKELRRYQDWLLSMYGYVSGAELMMALEVKGITQDWAKGQDALRAAYVSSDQYTWSYALETYEILFPETRTCRVALLQRHREIREPLHNLVMGLLLNSERIKVVNAAVALKDCVMDQASLAQDLLIYLQNKCLSNLTGNRVTERALSNPQTPRLVTDQEGNVIVSGGDSGSKV